MKKLGKNKVLVFIDWFYPAFKAGGPIKSIHHIAESLSHEIDFYILTSNTDIGSEVLDVPTNKWVEREFYSVIYLDASQQSINIYQKIENEIEPDVIYYNNMFSLNFGIKPLWLFRKRRNIKQLIAPRGMLGQGALRIKSLKKKLFLVFAKKVLYNDFLVWHASTNQEAKEIKNIISKKATVQIAQNLSSQLVKRSQDSLIKEPGSLSLVFISRISEKKNLLFLISLFQTLKEYAFLTLDIYGPKESQIYWDKIKNLIEQDNRINYKGELKPYEIPKTLQKYHLYCLPSFHENYGHSIVEAWLCGLPVLISNNTPWQNLKEKGVGVNLSLDKPDIWQKELQYFLQMNQNDYDQIIKKCVEFSKIELLNKKVFSDNRKLFLYQSN